LHLQGEPMTVNAQAINPTFELNADYQKAISDLMNHGYESAPRGQKTKEIINYSFSLVNPRNRIVHFPDRKTSLKYLLGEFIWYISGSADPKGILPYAKFWDSIRNPDGTVNSNYGTRLFGHHQDSLVTRDGQKMSQWQAVINILTKDNDSRQAIVNIHMPSDRWDGNKDVPCTISLQFLIRDWRLHMIVTMRSNDVIMGTSNDIFQFTMLQEALALELRKTMPALELGYYYHNAGSLHIYERHFEMAKGIMEDNRKLELSMRPMDSFSDNVLTGLVGVEAAWQHAGAPKDFDFAKVGAWQLLTPYWQDLVLMCFADDHSAMHRVFAIPEDEEH
jgi:thymidylate synthase